MFREMRRKRQQLTQEACTDILNRMSCGTLALLGDEGYPYALPISYVYANGKIYLHSALQGHKVDAILQHDKVSFCVIEQDQVVPERFTTYFRSVILFGRARLLTDDDDKRAALQKLGEKYAPGDAPALQAEIEKELKRTLVIEIAIDHMTGKEAIELTRPFP